MDMDDIKQMAVRLAMLIDSFEKRGERVEQIVAQATQSMVQASKSSEAVAERTTSRALQDFRETAAAQLGDGLRAPVEHANQTIQTSIQNLHGAIHALEQQQRDANRTHKRDAWKVFIASTLASLVMLGGSVYAMTRAREEMANAHWVSGVNAAIEAGRLAPCGDDGICVYANKQWMRLDQMGAPREPAGKKK
jgi:cation transport ATPase